MNDPRKKQIHASGATSCGAFITKRSVGKIAQKSAAMAMSVGKTPELSLKMSQTTMAQSPTNRENFSSESGLKYSPLKRVNMKISVGLTQKIRVSIRVT